ncbi:hypothetical protein JTB14_023779 [Gonioctena quinquepunctata]|nr:hypothetical protein JTB14_023779 [Gonioctena quinquepunctata]
MLLAKNLPMSYWAGAVNTAVYVINRTGNSSITNKSPFELWFSKELSYELLKNLQIFGSEIFVHMPKEKLKKWDSKNKKGIFVGYGENVKAQTGM